MDKKIELKVFEAYDVDVGKPSVRIDYNSMNSIGASTDDIIEIEGKRKTVARCLPLYPHDERKEMIRIDGLIRHNAGIEIDDIVTIRKIIPKRAEKVIVRPVASSPPIDGRYIRDALEATPLMKGDHLLIPYFGGRIDFEVVDSTPTEEAIVVDQKTLVDIDKNSGLATNASVYLRNNIHIEKLSRWKDIVEQYEKRLLEIQEEYRNISRNMLKENHKVKDIKKFLNSNMNESLIVIHEKLLDAYRQYVAELERINKN